MLPHVSVLLHVVAHRCIPQNGIVAQPAYPVASAPFCAERSQWDVQDEATLPPNDVTSEIADVMAQAVQAYGVDGAVVLMVVQPGERNAFDQQVQLCMFQAISSGDYMHITSSLLHELHQASCQSP